MLTFEQKLQILESYPQLQRKNVSLGRVNFHYEESKSEKKTVALHIHPNGNGFVYAGLLQGYDVDDKGFVNIREFNEHELKTLVEASIRSLSSNEEEPSSLNNHVVESTTETETRQVYGVEEWVNDDGDVLTLTRDEDLWYVYTGAVIEMVFGTPEEAKEYLWDEGFTPSKK